MPGIEFTPFVFALPVAVAMFAQSDRHATMDKIPQRRQRRRERERELITQARAAAWMQEQQRGSSPDRRRIATPSPTPRTDTPTEPFAASVEVTLEDFYQA